jgi:environmental stress-induced protein Ves
MTDLLVRRLDAMPLQPWKNGGGFARELAAGDGWRISLAEVERDGPFSVYDGVTRHSVVVSGAGLRLQERGETVDLAPFEPATYEGGRAWQATLRNGRVQVLNVMADAGRWSVRMSAGLALDDRDAFSACLVLPVACECLCSVTRTKPVTVRRGQYLCHAPEHPGSRISAHAVSGLRDRQAGVVLVALAHP